jgi:hypothetical protein
MKIITLRARFSVALSLFALAGSAAVAQSSSGGAPTSINTAFVKMFGSVAAFTAKAEAQVFDQAQKETVRMPMDFAVLDGKARLEINLALMQGKDLPASTITALKERGMDRVISVFRPDRKATFVMYPGIQSYMTVPMPKDEADVSEASLKLEKTALGKETIDGHACVKNKAVVKNGQTLVFEAVTWNASDLKDFPVLIDIRSTQSTVRMHFTQVRFTRPDAKQFDTPANYSPMK